MADIVKDATFYRIKQIELAEAEYYKSLIKTLDRIEREVVATASRLPLTDGFPSSLLLFSPLFPLPPPLPLKN
jgi:hypothetical protein